MIKITNMTQKPMFQKHTASNSCNFYTNLFRNSILTIFGEQIFWLGCDIIDQFIKKKMIKLTNMAQKPMFQEYMPSNSCNFYTNLFRNSIQTIEGNRFFIGSTLKKWKIKYISCIYTPPPFHVMLLNRLGLENCTLDMYFWKLERFKS